MLSIKFRLENMRKQMTAERKEKEKQVSQG